MKESFTRKAGIGRPGDDKSLWIRAPLMAQNHPEAPPVSTPSQDPLVEFLAQETLAVVGASNDRRKYGNTVYRDMRAKGYSVIPVNPTAETIEGDKCYPDLASLPSKPDGVILVVPPPVTEKVVEQAADLGIERIWMQEGAESEKAIQTCRDRGISVIHGVCVMVQARKG